jgi:two-component system, chemotaxis family, sensor kinase CheA
MAPALEVAAAPIAPAAAPFAEQPKAPAQAEKVREKPQKEVNVKDAKAADPKPATDADIPKGDKVANQSIRVNVDTLELLMTMVSELVLTATNCSRSAAATRTPSSRCRCSASPTSPPSCRKAS